MRVRAAADAAQLWHRYALPTCDDAPPGALDAVMHTFSEALDVAPERETPGISARHCARPTFSASATPMSSIVGTRGVRVSAQRSMSRMATPPTISERWAGCGVLAAAV